MRTTDTHVYFWGSYLSNFWLCPIRSTGRMIIQDVVYKSSEHVFMVEKAMHFGDDAIATRMLDAPDGKSVKALGKQVRGFDDEEWSLVREEKMHIACHAKFSQNEDLARKLLETGNRVIVEASPLDTIWGVGLIETDDAILDSNNWKGLNLLGKVLMDVRESLR